VRAQGCRFLGQIGQIASAEGGPHLFWGFALWNHCDGAGEIWGRAGPPRRNDKRWQIKAEHRAMATDSHNGMICHLDGEGGARNTEGQRKK